mgnify:FL=1
MAKVTEFPHPYVTVDVLIFSIIEDELNILLIKRSNEPFKGKFALPGGFVAVEENLDAAVIRVIKTKAGMAGIYVEQLYSFGEIKRDPRGRVISIAYLALVPEERTKIVNDEVHTIEWFKVNKLPPLGFDHKRIIEAGFNRLKSKLDYSNIAVGLMSQRFGLGGLQRVYETILGRPLDKRNFRKKMLSLDLLKEVGESKGGRHRPSKLYSFESSKPVFFK